MMSEERLKEIEERVKAAHKGPWGADPYIGNDCGVRISIEQIDPRCDLVSWRGMVMCYSLEDSRQECDPVALANAAFIAHARTDVPALIAALKEARIENRWLRAKLAKEEETSESSSVQ